MSLSVIIIARNESRVIARCLESVNWADEIILLDSGSTDDTVAIARSLKAKVTVTADWPGYGAQKNRALDLATGAWIFSLDADEWVTPELRAEIESVQRTSADFAAFRLPRLSSYCGRAMRHSGWWPDHVTRLFKRGSARFSTDLVHERVIVDGETGTLKSALMHEAIVDLADAIGKMNAYSTAGATMRHQRGDNATLTGAVVHGVWTFVRTYFLRGGFLDGREGFMLAVSNAEGAYYRYAKLALLGKNGKE